MKYTVTENPPPYTQGLSTTSSINIELNKSNIGGQQRFSNRLVDIPTYNIIQKVPIKSSSTTVNSTVINQDITIINQGTSKTAAQYVHTNPINNISTRTLLTNNGGLGTYDDNTIAIWTTLNNKIICNAPKEFIQATLNIKCSTDTLGGAFEIEVFNGTSIDIIENTINIQSQDFNVEFNIVTDQNCVTNGLQFFITPELGMILNINAFSLLIIKG